jgi:hypothetical protein
LIEGDFENRNTDLMRRSDIILPNEPTREFLLAPDLGAWLNRRNLVMLVLEIVQKLDEARLLEHDAKM